MSQDDPPKNLWSLVDAWLRRRGVAGLLVLTVLAVWWQWDHIRDLPGVEAISGAITRKSLPRAVPERFNVAVARLQGDRGREMEALIREALAETTSINVLSFDRVVMLEGSDANESLRNAHEFARTLLAESGADVLVWGTVLRNGDVAVPKLYWTTGRHLSSVVPAGRYRMTDALSLPPIFWQDLTSVLGLLVAASDAEFTSLRGKFRKDKLDRFIEQVQSLLRSDEAVQWKPGVRAQILIILGKAYVADAADSWRVEPLRDAAKAFEGALGQLTRNESPLEWATASHGLGVATASLAEREPGAVGLHKAISIFQSALEERTREKVPQDWAATQGSLANALAFLGERTRDKGQLQKALKIYDAALAVFTRDSAPLDWASTQHNRGNALASLGRLSSDSRFLADALAAFDAASLEYTRKEAPLAWASTQHNAAVALAALGIQSKDAARFEQAILVFQDALSERTRDRLPIQWAITQSSLGHAYSSLGELKKDPAIMKMAIDAFDKSLEVISRESQPLEWETIKVNLGASLALLGDLNSDPEKVRESIACYRDALKSTSRDKSPTNWALLQHNLGISYELVAELTSDRKVLKDAAHAYAQAALGYREAGDAATAKQTQYRSQLITKRLSNLE